MIKITFMGAGSTVFLRNVLGDCIYTDALKGMEIALYDIDGQRLEQSAAILEAINKGNGCPASIRSYLGAENRRKALSGADFVINAIQVGGYDPCTITDFEIPKKYGLRQTIGDTLGIGGIMRALRTIPVLEDFARDMEAVCPNAWFLNYTNPMSMLTGYMLRYTGSPASITWAGCWISATGMATICTLRSAGVQRRKTPPRSTMIWSASITLKNWVITVRSPANTTPNTTHFISRRVIRS